MFSVRYRVGLRLGGSGGAKDLGKDFRVRGFGVWSFWKVYRVREVN